MSQTQTLVRTASGKFKVIFSNHPVAETKQVVSPRFSTPSSSSSPASFFVVKLVNSILQYLEWLSVLISFDNLYCSIWALLHIGVPFISLHSLAIVFFSTLFIYTFDHAFDDDDDKTETDKKKDVKKEDNLDERSQFHRSKGFKAFSIMTGIITFVLMAFGPITAWAFFTISMLAGIVYNINLPIIGAPRSYILGKPTIVGFCTTLGLVFVPYCFSFSSSSLFSHLLPNFSTVINAFIFMFNVVTISSIALDIVDVLEDTLKNPSSKTLPMALGVKQVKKYTIVYLLAFLVVETFILKRVECFIMYTYLLFAIALFNERTPKFIGSMLMDNFGLQLLSCYLLKCLVMNIIS